MKTVDWDRVRDEFPGLTGRTFLDAACVSLMPRRAEKAVTNFSHKLVTPETDDATSHHIWMDRLREAAVPEVAKMFGCGDDNIALIESTTHGLNIAAQSIPLKEGDEVVMCDLEYLQVAIPFVKLAETAGVKTLFVKHRNGIADVEMFSRLLSPRTKAVVVSSTQWTNGYRIDLPALAGLCRSRDVWLVVDAIQQAGAVPVELDSVDFIIAGGHKWLNAPMGTGFLYLSDRVLDELTPVSWGYMNLEPPEGGWGNYFATPTITPDRDYRFVRAAKRFEIGGTSNYPGAIALAESVALVNEIGIDSIADRIWQLGEMLIEGLKRLDVTLQTPFGRDRRAGIVSFSLGSRERDEACLNFLLARSIMVSQRYTSNVGGVRISVHYFNNENDIALLLEAVKKFLKQ